MPVRRDRMADLRKPSLKDSVPTLPHGEGGVASPTVFLVDPDPQVQTSVRVLVDSVGLTAETYSSSAEFLAAYDRARPGCLIFELRLPGLGGLELWQRMARHTSCSPVIILTAHGDVETAVRALRAGALDFLQKPVHPQHLLERISEALECDAARRRCHAMLQSLQVRLAGLGAQERAIMDQVVGGRTNRSIAAALGVSRRAVEGHRARLMRKMNARSLAELVRMSIVLAHGVDVLSPRGDGWAGAAPERAARLQPDDLLDYAAGPVGPARAAAEHVQFSQRVAPG